MSSSPKPLQKIDLTESVAGEEDPGASIDSVAKVPKPKAEIPADEAAQVERKPEDSA